MFFFVAEIIHWESFDCGRWSLNSNLVRGEIIHDQVLNLVFFPFSSISFKDVA
jgi:hypothetical protein